MLTLLLARLKRHTHTLTMEPKTCATLVSLLTNVAKLVTSAPSSVLLGAAPPLVNVAVRLKAVD